MISEVVETDSYRTSRLVGNSLSDSVSQFHSLTLTQSLTSADSEVDFFRVLSKLDHLACNQFLKLQLSLTPLL